MLSQAEALTESAKTTTTSSGGSPAWKLKKNDREKEQKNLTEHSKVWDKYTLTEFRVLMSASRLKRSWHTLESNRRHSYRNKKCRNSRVSAPFSDFLIRR